MGKERGERGREGEGRERERGREGGERGERTGERGREIYVERERGGGGMERGRERRGVTQTLTHADKDSLLCGLHECLSTMYDCCLPQS